MSVERDQTGDAQKLPDEEARYLLARASEIESAQSAELSLAELREVALEAGIAPTAFEQALIEFHTGPAIPDSQTMQPSSKVRSRFTNALLDSAKTIGLVIGTLVFIMLLMTGSASDLLSIYTREIGQGFDLSGKPTCAESCDLTIGDADAA